MYNRGSVFDLNVSPNLCVRFVCLHSEHADNHELTLSWRASFTLSTAAI